MVKLFDNVADLRYEEDNEKEIQVATGMYSKEGEFVDFSEPCFCEGQVNNQTRGKPGHRQHNWIR